MADFEKPSNLEEEYFAREDVEKKRKLALQQHQELETAQKAALKKLHYMKCPKCGMDLHTLKRGKVDVDMCFNCKGVWLDEGELTHAIEQQEQFGSQLIGAVLNIFKKKPAGPAK